MPPTITCKSSFASTAIYILYSVHAPLTWNALHYILYSVHAPLTWNTLHVVTIEQPLCYLHIIQCSCTIDMKCTALYIHCMLSQLNNIYAIYTVNIYYIYIYDSSSFIDAARERKERKSIYPKLWSTNQKCMVLWSGIKN